MNNDNLTLHSHEAEQALIGALIRKPNDLIDASDIVRLGDFYFPQTKQIFKIMLALDYNRTAIDVITVGEILAAETGTDESFIFLSEMVENSAGINVSAYAKIIKNKSIVRNIHNTCSDICRYISENPKSDKDEIVNITQKALVDMENGATEELSSISVPMAFKGLVADIEARLDSENPFNGLTSGFEGIDNCVSGWKPGLIIVAGRPSMGKSTYALQLSNHLDLGLGLNGLFFSLEMSTNQLTQKLTALNGMLDQDFIENPKNYNSGDNWAKLEVAGGKMQNSKLSFVDCPGIHINQVMSYARKAHRRSKIDFIFIDHLHLMSYDGNDEVKGLSMITRQLKMLSGELEIPVFLLAQLNRKVEERVSKRPMMSDLRGSGSIEQDADVIQFIYRDDYYNENTVNDGLVLIDTVKIRMGKPGPVTLLNKYSQSRLEHTNREMCFDPPKNHYSKRNEL